MTIDGCLDLFDAQKPNAYDRAVKVSWLDKLDRMACRDVFDNYEEGPDGFDGYDAETDGDTELLIPDDFRDVYIYWLGAMIDYANQEMTRYANSMIMFNNAWGEFASWWNRTHRAHHAPVIGAGGRIWR